MANKATLLFIAGILSAPFFTTAQNNDAGIEKQFAQYRAKALTEKVYIHTDKNYYLAGEVLWWKLYYVDGSFHKPADLSKVVYVEILDNNNKPVLQAKAALSKDGSNGSFYLPVSVNSGNYTLRAYTNWMKNFGADYFFEKPITIVNAMKVAGLPAAAGTALYDARFFPEGGNLVRNLESKVAFRVTDQYGKGQSFAGAVINEANDTLVRFAPIKNGIGSFLFTPLPNHTYKAVLQLSNGQTLLRDLPAIFEQGYVMRLVANNDGSLLVTVNTNVANAQSVSLFAHTRQVMKAGARLFVSNGTASFTIGSKQLGEGISHITIFDNRQQPVCERLYFKYPAQQLSIAASSNTGEYGLRKKVNLSVQTTTAAAVTPASVSVAVYRVDSLEAPLQDNIQSYLWLSSDLKGTVESPASYFPGNTPETKEAMDNLMLTHGWRRFSWDALVKDSFHVAYMPEFDGHIITGSLVNASNGRPAPNVVTYLSIPGSLVQFYPMVSDSFGKLQYDVRDYYGPGEIVLQADNSSLSSYRFDITNPFADPKTPMYRPQPLALTETSAGDLTKASIGMQVQNVYRSEELSKFDLPAIDTMPFYGKHGTIYNLDDYTRFTTMEEVLREYVLEVGVRRRDGQQVLLVTDFANKGFYSREPIILLDGVPVSNEKILSYDPLKVKKLQVVASRYLLGDFVYDGVVSMTTYKGTVEDLQLSTKATILDYDGLQLKREFFSPEYATEQQVGNRLPDYRNQLYWAPDVKTNAKGDASVVFYTSDMKGKYVVVIEGMDEAGHAGTYSFTFDVKPRQ